MRSLLVLAVVAVLCAGAFGQGAPSPSTPPSSLVNASPPSTVMNTPPPSSVVNAPPPSSVVSAPPPSSVMNAPPPSPAVNAPPPSPLVNPPPPSPVVNPPPPPPVVVSPTPQLKRDVCRNLGEIIGTPTYDNTSTSERNCFFKCDNNNANYYTYNDATRRCACFKPGNISYIQPDVQSTITPTFDYYVYGSIQACFPYCSVAVNDCGRCNIKVPKGQEKPFCIQNFSRTRCCCYPPSKVYVKKGKIVGCTRTGRAR